MSNPNITINIFANTAQANAALKGVNSVLGQVGGKGAASATAGMTSLGASAARLIPGLLGITSAFMALRKAMQITKDMIAVNMEFEDTMAAVKAVAQTSSSFTENAYKRMEAEARKLGATTRFSATEAAEGLKYLSMAGFTAEESTKALSSTLKLAQAGALDLGTAADIVSNVMTAFGAKADQTKQFANALAVVASRSNTDILQLGEAMKYVGPIAGGLSRQVEETSAAIGVLGNAGVQASMAGTALRGVMIQIADPTSKAHRALLDMGMTANELDLTDKNNTLVALFQRMADVGVDAANAYSLFGARAGVAAQQLTANIDKFRELNDEVVGNKDGLDRMAETMDDTMTGAVKRVKSAWQELVLQFGNSGINDVLREIVEDVAAMISAWNDSGAIVEAGRKFATIVDTIYQSMKAVGSSNTGTVLLEIGNALGYLISFTNPIMRLGTAILDFNDAIGATSAASMNRRADDFQDFFDEVQAKSKKVTSNTDIEAINGMLVAERKRLDTVRDGILENKKLTDQQRKEELAQLDNQMAVLRKMQGLQLGPNGNEIDDKSLNNMQVRMQTAVNLAQAAAEEAEQRKIITEESIAAKEAEVERAEQMRDLLASYDKESKRSAIDEQFKEFGQARAKFSAVLDLEGFDSSMEVQDEIDALRDKMAEGLKGNGVVGEDDVARLQYLIDLMKDLRQLKQKVRDEKTQKEETAAEGKAATKEADQQQELLDAKLAGDKQRVAQLEREDAIRRKTAEYEKQGVQEAEKRATAFVDAQAKLKQQQEAATKQSFTTKGGFASALDRIMGRSADELIAKESARQTALQEQTKREQETQTEILERIEKKLAPGTFT